MKNYEVIFASGGATTVSAPDEYTARTQAMIERYGDRPSAVVPHAPDYRGNGLRVVEVSA